MGRSMRAAASALTCAALAIGTTFVGVASCGESFEPPCRIEDRSVVVPISLLSPRMGPLAITEGRDGQTVVVAFAAGALPDAGAQDGAQDGEAQDGGAVAFVAPRATVVVLESGGARRFSQTFEPPSGLRARRGSTRSVGAAFTGDGALFHWEELTVTTAADGATTSSAALLLQRVAQDGGEGALASDPELACTRCTTTSAFATIGTTTVAVVAQLPDATAGAGSMKSRVRLFAFDADGRTVASVALDALAAPALALALSEPPPPAALGGTGLGAVSLLGVRLTVQRGLFVVRVGRRGAFFDTALAQLGGPYDLPTDEAELDIDPGTGRVAIVYNATATLAADAARPVSVGGQPDLVFESRDATGARVTASRRITASLTALDVRRNGARTGVVHSATDGVFFSLVDDRGKKIGGDHPLVLPASRQAGSTGISTVDPFDRRVPRTSLTTPDATHFVFWSATNEVVREVIACDP